jgi:hypothetical protein
MGRHAEAALASKLTHPAPQTRARNRRSRGRCASHLTYTRRRGPSRL